ncbi:DUF4384 domain-containing protein [Magnetospirillum sp. UT-4]|uniref:DUF4384 domain-containing protein n=1 Tax=Magnetospirillum sp. UT-4 TaxID=2681467 RepID=UPI0013823CB9|nr:DUF4384 domain-containing protein [Magnetospirillum sp. UT-4]CAA7627234.1 conserved exported hypothetical protein [Magnetospirillum sp. UT-4]
MRKAAAALCLFLLPATANAEWVRATGTYLFPPIMPEAEACQNAEERARADAIRQVTGETFSAEDTLRCTEQGDVAECARNSALWSTVDGYIRDIRGRTSQSVANVAGHRECIVSFEADVQVAKGRPDPGFDVGVGINQPVFRDGEKLSVTLSPSQKMAVQVFQWLPYQRDDGGVSRIFPNTFDQVSVIERTVTVPTEAGSKRYDMQVTFPDGMPPGRKMVDEYLIVIATKKPIPFRDAYSLDDFRRLLAEIPRDESRIVRKAYNIVRGNR